MDRKESAPTPPSTAIICISPHHGNTAKIARAMCEASGATLLSVDEAARGSLTGYDLAGFGSGIYYARHHRMLRNLVEAIASLPPRAFLFSTAGLPCMARVYHWSLRRRLAARGCNVVGEFCCRGWDTFGPLMLVGGINRSRPNAHDLERAAEFARRLCCGGETS
jgi:flavodoxin